MLGLNNKVVIVTGGGGLMGEMFVRTISKNGGVPIAVDIDETSLANLEESMKLEKREALYIKADITKKGDWINIRDQVLNKYSRIDVLINNAAANPKVSKSDDMESNNFEDYPIEKWQKEFDISLSGAFLGCQVIGAHFRSIGAGNIINIGSDLAVISPDQRIYQTSNI